MGDMSGYEIKGCFERSIGFFWNAGFSQIYPELDKLTRDGLVERRFIVQRGKPGKNIHRITRKGEDEFLKWLKRPVRLRFMKDEFLLKVFFFHKLEWDEILAHLTRHLSLCEERLSTLREIERVARTTCTEFQMLDVRNGIMHFEVDVKWLKEAIAFVKGKMQRKEGRGCERKNQGV
jgi:DNA-binding PadR family transcriptional regulator